MASQEFEPRITDLWSWNFEGKARTLDVPPKSRKNMSDDHYTHTSMANASVIYLRCSADSRHPSRK